MNETATKREPVKPTELWMLWCPDAGPNEQGDWVQAIEEYQAVCCTSESDAKQAVERTKRIYEIDCYPVRVI